MSCGKFKTWFFGPKSLMCRIFGACLCNPEPAPPVVDPTPPPVEPPVVPPPPPPVVYVTREICTRTGLLALDTCKVIGCVEKHEFVKGKQPTMKCLLHAHWKYPKPIKELSVGGYILLWIIRIGYLTKDRVAMKENLFFTLRRFRSLQFYLVEAFTWLDSGRAEHKHLNGKTPWIFTGKTFGLGIWNITYWDMIEDALSVFKLFSPMELQPIFFMRDEYHARLFQQNSKNITRMKSTAFIPYAVEYALKWQETFRKVYGDKHTMFYRVSNEWFHSSPAEFRMNGYFEWRVTEALDDQSVPIWKNTVDLSGSEGCEIFKNEPQEHPKLGGEVLPLPVHFLSVAADRSKRNKCILPEKHGCGSVSSLMRETEDMHFLGSKWCKFKISLDGGTGPKNNQDGNGLKVGNFAFPDCDQYFDTLCYFLESCKRKGKIGYIGHWIPECFTKIENGKRVPNLWIEDCSEENLDWKMAEVPSKAWKKVYP